MAAGDAAGASSQFAFIAGGNVSQTLMRIRGTWRAWMDASGSAAADIVRVACGVIPVSSGGTTTSLPLTDGDAPWIWYGIATLGAETAVGNVGAPTEFVEREIDSKAMRIIRPDIDLVVVMESADVVGAPLTNQTFDARVLFAD